MNWPLKQAIHERFERQYRAAAAAGIPERTLSRIVNGLRTPTPAEEEALCRALGKPPQELFEQQRTTGA